ncbi:MAG: DNA repair protein RadC [Thermotogae bacterium]|nr:DNA repair protein RadC [Thermotogota bacterium]
MLPREKALKYGEESLSNEELIAVILRKGVKGINVFELSKKIVQDFDLIKLSEMTIEELSKIKGIGQVSAINLKASLEIGKRYHLEMQRSNTYKINSPEDAYKFSEDMIHFDKEVVRVINLNSKLGIINFEDISKGTVNSSIAHPRDIFKSAIKNNAVTIILLHNHPSGDPSPSIQDRELTEKVKESGKILGIKLNDHIIIGKNSFYSFNKSMICSGV